MTEEQKIEAKLLFDGALAVERMAAQFKPMVAAAEALRSLGSLENAIEEKQKALAALSEKCADAEMMIAATKDQLSTLVNDATSQGRAIFDEAEQSAARVKSEAERKAAEIVDGAQRQADGIRALAEKEVEEKRSVLGGLEAKLDRIGKEVKAAEAKRDAALAELAAAQAAFDALRAKLGAAAPTTE